MLRFGLYLLILGFMPCLLIIGDRLSCNEYKDKMQLVFYPLRHCQRSNETVIGWINTNNVAKCAEFARKRKAMAFNYASLNRGNINLFKQPKAGSNTNQSKFLNSNINEQPEEFFNCEALACPEFKNFSHIVNDTRFDYYSLYTNPPLQINVTCIPTVGIFQHFNEFADYSMATKSCLTINGSLAHILSESRTNALSKLIEQQNTRLKIAYVGLNQTTRNKFRTSYDEPIECFLYRAWAPGHPMQSKSLSCVAITDENSWQTYKCAKRLPFICEIHTSGPPANSINFKSKCSVKKDNNIKSVQVNNVDTKKLY